MRDPAIILKRPRQWKEAFRCFAVYCCVHVDVQEKRMREGKKAMAWLRTMASQSTRTHFTPAVTNLDSSAIHTRRAR